MGVIRLGFSGWDYRDWADVFYKDKDESKLRAYSRIFKFAFSFLQMIRIYMIKIKYFEKK